MSEQEVDRTGQIQVGLNAVSAARLTRLRHAHAFTESWPAFHQLYAIPGRNGETVLTDALEFDVLAAHLQVLNAEPDLPNEAFDRILGAYIAKIQRKGGSNCALTQIQDVAYEAMVALLLERFMPGRARFGESDDNEPDLSFAVTFQETNVREDVAIECKNITRGNKTLLDLIRDVQGAISNAVNQHQSRRDRFGDLVIFIDLPRSALVMTKRSYYQMIVGVWQGLSLAGLNICESQVVFTATAQKDMAEHILARRDDGLNLTLLAPVVVKKTEVAVGFARMFFLSLLMRNLTDAPNVGNWSHFAVRIDDPENYALS